MSQNTIIVDGVSKAFKLPHEKQGSIKSAFVNILKRTKSYEQQDVLKDLNFSIEKGEFYGIVGRNGSGKSTLLKLLAGVYSPDKGAISVKGKLTPFIELGVGFNPELTGRENVYLNGALLGFSRKEMSALYDEIVTFAELEKFMDQKLKNYSSGMQVRLAFSIAIRAKSDILLIDEVLAVGDAAFQQKCYEHFALLKESGTTVVLVTHDMAAVQRFCTKALLISNGEIKLLGSPSQIADKYLELNYKNGLKSKKKDSKSEKVQEAAYIENIKVFDSNGSVKDTFSTNQKISVNFKTNIVSDSEDSVHLGLQVFNENNAYCFGTNTQIDGQKAIKAKKFIASFEIDCTLVPGKYELTLAVMNNTATKVIAYKPRVKSFRIKQDTKQEGVAIMDHAWSIKNV